MNEVLGFAGELALLVLCVPVLTWALYLAALSVLSFPPKPPLAPSPPSSRFDFVVPAHNESLGIAATVKSLLSVDYPAELFRVLVVADNCTDDTATRAREAGAIVLERFNAELRGKGYALEHAFARCLKEGADAVVVVDADTLVSKNLLSAFAARLAAGNVAVQAHYGVQNPNASWRTRLMRIALSMFHQVRSIGRERLKVSAGLRGNGMCFRTSLLREVPHDAYSLVEDLEYGIRLGRRGFRVAYAWEADVLGEMVSGEAASRSQRNRWEQGRAQMLAQHGWPLLRDGLKERSALLMDLAMDVLVPPLSRVVGFSLLGAMASALLLALVGHGAIASAAFGVALWCVALYVFAGWLHSGTGLRGLMDLGLAPAYVAWKVVLAFRVPRGQKQTEWVRTTREGETRP
ncbi:MAG: glycosyltransferase [Archangium sp.]|nr:glycosyltransferase [Archangium sp.]MDP3569167.1 glycosyltransferase [Archangium sp.]